MSSIWYLALALVVLALGFLTWGAVRVRARSRDAQQLALSVTPAQVPDLVAECVAIARDRLGELLDPSDPDKTAQTLDTILSPSRRLATQIAFERPDHPGWFVLPLGAVLGELLRVDECACWLPAERGGLSLEFEMGGGVVTAHPFDKILKHATTGRDGDIVAYVAFASRDAGRREAAG